MNPDEAAEKLAAVPGLSWSKEAWADFLACPPDAQLRMLLELQASAEPPGTDWAGGVLTVLKTFLAIAGGVSGVTGAIAGVQSVKW